jgi:hypothetical protein
LVLRVWRHEHWGGRNSLPPLLKIAKYSSMNITTAIDFSALPRAMRE